MDGFDDAGEDLAGAGLVSGGDTEVCAIAALDRATVKNIAFRQKLVRDISVSSCKQRPG